MPFDRVFADQDELDTAQGNNELVENEIYRIMEGDKVVFAIGPSEYERLFGSDDNASFLNVSVSDSVDVGGFFSVDGNKVVGNRAGPVSSPTGGSVVDTQCRAALTDLLAILRPAGHGLISNS